MSCHLLAGEMAGITTTRSLAFARAAVCHKRYGFHRTNSLVWLSRSGYSQPIIGVFSSIPNPTYGRGSRHSTGKSKTANKEGTSIPRTESVKESTASASHQESLNQDHFYEHSTQNATASSVPPSEMSIEQEKAKESPLPDGSVPPSSTSATRILAASRSVVKSESPSQPSADTIAEAEKARRSQRLSELQIPSKEAEGPSATSPDVEPLDSIGSGSRVEQDSDVFYSSQSNASPVLSSLPRVKVPKASVNAQDGDEHVPERGINQDIFYSSQPAPESTPSADAQAVPDRNEPREEMYSELFHSPKVSRMLRQRPGSESGRNDLRLQQPSGAAPLPKKLSTATDQETYVDQAASASAPRPAEASDDISQLASDIAQDAASSSGNSSVSKFARAAKTAC